jgi:hypothetical protein
MWSAFQVEFKLCIDVHQKPNSALLTWFWVFGRQVAAENAARSYHPLTVPEYELKYE